MTVYLFREVDLEDERHLVINEVVLDFKTYVLIVNKAKFEEVSAKGATGPSEELFDLSTMWMEELAGELFPVQGEMVERLEAVIMEEYA